VFVAGHQVPDSELEWTFSPSGGPGGQHANRSSTRAEVRLDLAASSAFPEDLKTSMIERLGRRAANGVVAAVADDTRSQARNRAIALRRLHDLLENAARRRRPRRPTRPTAASREQRLEQKRRRSQLKQARRRTYD
jgi:ribosome-associated protein